MRIPKCSNVAVCLQVWVDAATQVFERCGMSTGVGGRGYTSVLMLQYVYMCGSMRLHKCSNVAVCLQVWVDVAIQVFQRCGMSTCVGRRGYTSVLTLRYVYRCGSMRIPKCSNVVVYLQVWMDAATQVF